LHIKKTFVTLYHKFCNRIMTELVLKNRISRQKLNSIVYFIKMQNVDVEIKDSAHKKVVKKDPFAEVRGIWADRDIDATTLRKRAWGIEE